MKYVLTMLGNAVVRRAHRVATGRDLTTGELRRLGPADQSFHWRAKLMALRGARDDESRNAASAMIAYGTSLMDDLLVAERAGENEWSDLYSQMKYDGNAYADGTHPDALAEEAAARAAVKDDEE